MRSQEKDRKKYQSTVQLWLKVRLGTEPETLEAGESKSFPEPLYWFLQVLDPKTLAYFYDILAYKDTNWNFNNRSIDYYISTPKFLKLQNSIYHKVQVNSSCNI